MKERKKKKKEDQSIQDLIFLSKSQNRDLWQVLILKTCISISFHGKKFLHFTARRIFYECLNSKFTPPAICHLSNQWLFGWNEPSQSHLASEKNFQHRACCCSSFFFSGFPWTFIFQHLRRKLKENSWCPGSIDKSWNHLLKEKYLYWNVMGFLRFGNL